MTTTPTEIVPFETYDGSNSIVAFDEIDRELEDLIISARSENTRRAYRAQWKIFVAWARRYGRKALPAEPADVARFLLMRFNDGASIPTIRSAVAAISCAHKDAGLENPCLNQGVKLAVVSLRKRNERASEQVSAMLDVQVDAIISTAMLPRRGRGGLYETPKFARKRGMVDIALILTMCDAGLRRSEAANARWRDLSEWEDGTGRLTVPRSKTDQYGDSEVLGIRDRTLTALKAIRPSDYQPDNPIFGLSDGQIARRIQSAVKAAGLDGRFGGHSCRIGMARGMTRKGAPTHVVMRQGRWKDPRMIAVYTRGESASEALRYL